MRDWKKSWRGRLLEAISVGDIPGGFDSYPVCECVESLLFEQEKEWRQIIEAIFDECTTDFGTTDFEMAAEKILHLISEEEEK
jgi:hypothetical protein